MNIAIEAQRLFRPDKHGMDYVALEIIREFQKQEDDNKYFVIVAPGDDHCLEESHNLSIVKLKCPTYPLWEQIALPLVVKKLGVDVLHCTSNTAPLWCPVPLVLTLHDIIYLNQSKGKGMSRYQKLGWYYRRLVVPTIIRKCYHIITVSQTESKNIIQRFPFIKGKLQVIHNAYSQCYHPIENFQTVTRRYLPENSYLLCLGNTDPRKNVKGTLIAYAHYREHSARKLPLILTGLSINTVHATLASLNLTGCKDYIVCPGYVPSEDLPALYNGAFAFLFPSFSEGFGIPILESMACGIPVITSNISAMPEVAGPEGLLVNPEKPNEITDILLRLESDEKFYRQQREYGLQRVKQFSWGIAVQKLIKIYQTLNQHQNPYNENSLPDI